MTAWPKHALALVLLAALNLGLYGRLYSPLDHAYPEGEAASAAITRFIAENPNPWGWNPMWSGGEPIQTKSLSAFHYLAAAVSKFGPIPIQAHRIVAITLALLTPLALYLMLTAFGTSWTFAMTSALASILVPHLLYQSGFLPDRLALLTYGGDAPYVGGITLIFLTIGMVWFAAHRNDSWSLFAAAVCMAFTLSFGLPAAVILLISLAMLDLAMLGIAGEYRFSHRRLYGAVVWTVLLSLGLTSYSIYSVIPSIPGSWLMFFFGALGIRLLFLGRREPLLCFLMLTAWALYRSDEEVALPIFVVTVIVLWSRKALDDHRPQYRLLALVPLLLLSFRFDGQRISIIHPPSLSRIKEQFREWRGDWGMRPPSQSDEFQLTRWFVENPPRGRISVQSENHLHSRLNAWVPFAQAGRSKADQPIDTKAFGIEYIVQRAETAAEKFPVVFKTSKSAIYRVPFQSLAMSVQGERDGPPLELTWLTNSHLKITGNLPKDHQLNIKVKNHPGWTSTLPIGTDANGMMLLAPPPGPINLDLTFNGTREQHIFGYLSGATWILSLGYVAIQSIRRKRA